MEFLELPEFARDLKRLRKKYRSLGDDIERLKQVLVQLPEGNGGKHWNRLHKREMPPILVFKVRLACAYLRENTMRVVYAYREASSAIDFIEIYYKGEQENESQERIKKYLLETASV